jgi:membrane associated rhomboid family serine protease
LIPLKDNIPTARFPILTVALIVINVAVFVWQETLSSDPGSSSSPHIPGVSAGDEAILEGGAIPYRLTHPGSECGVAYLRSAPSHQKVVCDGTADARRLAAAEASGQVQFVKLDAPPWWLTILTSMFLHASILHIGFNMLFLWIFGNNVEDSMGRPRFLAFYLIAGIVAAYAQALFSSSATEPAIGASGAIAGVLGGYAVLYPRARVLTIVLIIFFFTLIEIPALLVLGIWFLLQFLPAVGQVATPDVAGGGGVAYLAHVGGFIFGLAAIRLFANRYRGSPAALG